jgi:hypothetical protein
MTLFIIFAAVWALLIVLVVALCVTARDGDVLVRAQPSLEAWPQVRRLSEPAHTADAERLTTAA